MATHLLLLGAAGFVAVGTFRLSDPLLPSIAEEFGVSIGGIATTIVAFTLGYALFQLLHGPLGDRIGKLRVITGSLALASLATIACGWAGTVTELAALRFAAGMTAGAVVPLSMAHIGDTVAYESRQATIARFLMAALIGQMIAGSIAGVLAEHFGWRQAFIAFGAAGLAVAACLWPPASRAARPAPPAASAAKITHLSLLRDAHARTVWAAAFLEGCITVGAVPFVGAHLRLGFGLDYATIGLVLACFGMGGLLYSLNVKPLMRRLGERGLIMAGGALAATGYLTGAAAPSWPFMVPALLLIGLGFFCIQGVLQLRATEIAPQARGTALSGFVFYLFLGQGTGAYVLGYVVDGPGYRPAFAIVATAVVLLAAWLTRALFRPAAA